MFILSQDKEDIVNIDTMLSITKNDDGDISVVFPRGDGYCLGIYTGEEQALVMAQILAFLEEPCNVNNRVFRMPPSSIGG